MTESFQFRLQSSASQNEVVSGLKGFAGFWETDAMVVKHVYGWFLGWFCATGQCVLEFRKEIARGATPVSVVDRSSVRFCKRTGEQTVSRA